jgi:hypothetical protein
LCELYRRNATAAARLLPRLRRMHDFARARHVLDRNELDPLDVPDDRGSHAPHAHKNVPGCV